METSASIDILYSNSVADTSYSKSEFGSAVSKSSNLSRSDISVQIAK